MYKTVFLCVLSLICFGADAQMDLKTYYEQQKDSIIPTFAAPELGSQVTLQLKSGPSRTGVLMKLDASAVSIMADTGSMISYQRNALQEETRSILFAEDYAHTKALEKTRMYKDQQQQEFKAEQEAGIHDGSISVTAKTSKESNTDKKSEDRENKKTGNTTTLITTTKTNKETQSLGITLTNKAGHPDRFTIEYYFFGQPISKGERTNAGKTKSETEPLKLHDSGTRTVTTKAWGRATIDLTSKPFEVEKVEVSYNGYSGNNPPRETGIENAGYLVVLKYGSTVLDKKASSRSYLNDDWLRQIK